MNAIVGIYKNFILGLLFLVLVGGTLAALIVISNGDLQSPERLGAIAAIIGAVILSFLIVAWSAVIISIHDRYNEIAEGVHRIAQALEERTPGGLSDVG